ncbi:SapC family protein [Gilvimarinus japonicus]|mgnify:CR=1 FL=1|uniref:SapC family protein n=1 Tax=Gilvimarinus japonicus TaxID=1796469 RepID=A0ABV7HSJ9_9GAMM
MSVELVNKNDHQGVKVITRKSEDFGDNVMLTQTFPLEFRHLQPHYPILFQKVRDTDRFIAVALFGFEEGENLFLEDSGWGASYVPLMIQRQPFQIGFQNKEDGVERVLHIDMSSPRVSTSEGSNLFSDHGEPTEFLDYMASALETIHLWAEQGDDFDKVLSGYDLLEPVTFDITLETGRQAQMLGFYTINEDVLAKLSGEALGELNEKGYLMPIYMAIGSLGNIKKLILLKSKREALED